MKPRHLLMVLGVMLVFGGLIWTLALEIKAYDIPMSRIKHTVYLWKPSLTVIIGLILFRLGYD